MIRFSVITSFMACILHSPCLRETEEEIQGGLGVAKLCANIGKSVGVAVRCRSKLVAYNLGSNAPILLENEAILIKKTKQKNGSLIELPPP